MSGTSATYGAALSRHPVPAHAAGEVLGEVLESVGSAPDLAFLFCTGPLVGALDDIARTVRSVLNPRVLVGATAVSVLGGASEVEEVGAITLWAARFGIDIEPIRLEAYPATSHEFLVAGSQQLSRSVGTLILITDPFSFPAESLLDHFGEARSELVVLGGMASSARGPGGNRLLLDDEIWTDGAVGVLLPPEIPIGAVVSQGCRPIGPPLTVTRSERNVLYELASQPALDRLMAILEALPPEERALAANGLHIGRVIDERRTTFERGDFLVRGVLGADRDAGAVAIGDELEVGVTVQFQVRDAASATEDLGRSLSGHRADAVLAFTCNGRGERLFGVPDHDAALIGELLGAPALSGMFCAGELGPVGGRSFVHGFTASLALFGDRP